MLNYDETDKIELKEKYTDTLPKEIVSFLNGNYAEVEKYLQDKMYQASEDMEFEKAAEYRDLLKSVMHIAQKQKINDNNEQDDISKCVINGHVSTIVLITFFVIMQFVVPISLQLFH